MRPVYRSAALIILLMSVNPARADIVVTRDGMVLNGKIIREDKISITFANYHGTFTIEKAQIRETHRTGSYQEDAKIFRSMGRKVVEKDVKKNYQSGVKELEGKEMQEKIPAALLTLKGIYLSPVIAINMGKIHQVIPLSASAAVSGDVTVNTDIMKKLHVRYLRCDIAFLRAKKESKSLYGIDLTAGPAWEFPARIASLRFNMSVSPFAGLGRYYISNASETERAVKWLAGLSAGPVIKYGKITFLARVRFDYVHDRDAPLFGPGFSVGAGYEFSMGRPD